MNLFQPQLMEKAIPFAFADNAKGTKQHAHCSIRFHSEPCDMWYDQFVTSCLGVHKGVGAQL